MKKILVVVPHIPAFNTNAGDYRIFHILRILSQKHRVSFFPLRKYEQGEDYYARQLRNMGVKILNATQINRTRFDTVIFEFYHSALKLIDRFRSSPYTRIIVDSHILKYIENERGGWLPEKELAKSRETELSIYRKADTVIAVSEREKGILKKETRAEVICIPMAVRIPDKIRNRKGRKNLVFIGYMNNLQNQDAVLWFVDKVLPRVLEEIPDVKFYIVGSFPPDKIKRLESVNIKVTGFVIDLTVYTSSCLVSVVPLRFGAGMKQKILESMAYGCPVVTTSIGAEGMGLSDSRDVLIAEKPEDFARKVISLYHNEKIWYRLSLNGYKKARKKYSMEIMEKKLLQAVERS